MPGSLAVLFSDRRNDRFPPLPDLAVAQARDSCWAFSLLANRDAWFSGTEPAWTFSRRGKIILGVGSVSSRRDGECRAGDGARR